MMTLLYQIDLLSRPRIRSSLNVGRSEDATFETIWSSYAVETGLFRQETSRLYLFAPHKLH
jgi:hypothetical protein